MRPRLAVRCPTGRYGAVSLFGKGSRDAGVFSTLKPSSTIVFHDLMLLYGRGHVFIWKVKHNLFAIERTLAALLLMMIVNVDIRRFESAMAEHPDRRESSDRGRSSTPEYGYIGSSTKTGREERAFQHGGTSPDSSQKKGGKAIPTTPSSTHTDRV